MSFRNNRFAPWAPRRSCRKPISRGGQTQRRGAARWSFALQAAGMVAWERDLATGAMNMSPGATAFLGLPADGQIASFADLAALVHPEDRGALAAADEQAQRTGAYDAEFRLVRADGSLIWVYAQGEAAPGGSSRRLHGVMQNITALKATQEALRLSEQRFRMILSGSPVTVFSQDCDLRYTWIYNPALGLEAEQVIGLSDYDLFERREDAERLIRMKRRVLETGAGARHEVTVWGNGREHTYDVTIEPLQGADGQVSGVTCAVMDISEHKRNEQSLRQANERLALALELLDGFLYEFDVVSGFTERSDGFARVVGYQSDTMPAHRDWWFDQIHPDDRETARRQARDAQQQGAATYSLEYRVRHHDGHYVTVWDRGHIQRDARGQVVRVLGTTLNISERKEADAERRELLGQVRQALEATEAALSKAEQATRERDLLISIAAHDLRSPLTVILGQAQLLRRRAASAGLEERHQRAISTIASQAERLNQMTAALLDISRIQEGRLTIDPRPGDLAALLDQVVGEVRLISPDHQLVLRLPDAPLSVLADPIRMEQVFHNLLGNAVKYSPNGGTIEVWAEVQGQTALVGIRDQGIGIPADALPNLFKRFYRAPNAGTQSGDSLGVGLYVVQELVQAHGGRVRVESAEGEGSTFLIELPLA